MCFRADNTLDALSAEADAAHEVRTGEIQVERRARRDDDGRPRKRDGDASVAAASSPVEPFNRYSYVASSTVSNTKCLSAFRPDGSTVDTRQLHSVIQSNVSDPPERPIADSQ